LPGRRLPEIEERSPVPPTTRAVESHASSSSAAVGVLALVIAVVVALTGTWSARPDEPERNGTRVRVGVFDRTRLDAGVAAGVGLERALAVIGETERLAWIGERPVSPAWRADDVEVVDVTETLRAKLAAPAGGAK
jgi:hypothetical protein